MDKEIIKKLLLNDQDETEAPEDLGPDKQILLFRINDKVYGFDIIKILEILKPIQLTRLPNAPKYIVGVINLRGEIIPVLDLKNLFGLGSVKITKSSRFIVANILNKNIGLIVDSIIQVKRIPDSQIEKPNNDISNTRVQYFSGFFNYDNHIVILIELDNLLTEEGLEISEN